MRIQIYRATDADYKKAEAISMEAPGQIEIFMDEDSFWGVDSCTLEFLIRTYGPFVVSLMVDYIVWALKVDFERMKEEYEQTQEEKRQKKAVLNEGERAMIFYIACGKDGVVAEYEDETGKVISLKNPTEEKMVEMEEIVQKGVLRVWGN